MNKKIRTLISLVLVVIGLVFPALAHENQNEHDSDLKYALFGDRDRSLNGDEKIAFQAIANAAAICIDQFSPNEEAQWKKGVFDDLQKELSALGLSTLSVSFSELDLNNRISKDNKNITANTHRQYTHLGWNYKRYPDNDFWATRKNVLIDTINKILFTDSGFLSQIPFVSDYLYAPNEQCDAFCAMVYYIHILGDHIEGNVPDKLTDLEPLIQYTNMAIPGIIAELKENIQVVFASQKGSWSIMDLMQELSDLGIRAERNCGTWGSIDTVEKCKVNQQYAKELLDILGRELPKLLRNEEFFYNTFTSIR